MGRRAQEEQGEKPDPNNLYFIDKIFGGAVPTRVHPVGGARLPRGCRKGAKYGFPCVDIQATLLDGKAHDVDSSQTRSSWPRSSASAMPRPAGLVLLEPIMNVVVHAPGQYLGDLTRDVSRRRGEILNTSLDKGRCQLHAYVPLAELFGYTSELRNFTSGTAAFTMEPSHYAPVKEELADLRAAS